MLYIFVKNKMLEQLGYPNIYYRTFYSLMANRKTNIESCFFTDFYTDMVLAASSASNAL